MFHSQLLKLKKITNILNAWWHRECYPLRAPHVVKESMFLGLHFIEQLEMNIFGDMEWRTNGIRPNDNAYTKLHVFSIIVNTFLKCTDGIDYDLRIEAESNFKDQLTKILLLNRRNSVKMPRFGYYYEILLNTVHGFYFGGQAKEVSKRVSNHIYFHFS